MIEERYEIVKLLGKGRTGGVYEAEDTNLGRKVALRRFFAQGKQADLAEYREDFEKVAHSLSSLQHPNLLRVYDAGIDDDGAYIISQLLNGETLHNRVKSESLSVWETNELAQQMLDALSTSHSEGFIHGAITPGSILMSPRARGGYLYVILDMGLSRLAPLIQGKDSVLSIMADPAILAPELFDGGVATERADLYMLGQILYMSLAGGHPFGGVPAKEAEKMHLAGLPSLKDFNKDVPEDFRLWIEKLTQINPEDRPESAVEALNLLPRSQRPATTPSADVFAATAHLKTGSTVQLQTPVGNVTGPLSSLEATPALASTGPLTAGAGGAAPNLVPKGGANTAVMPQVLPQVAGSSNKVLFIGLALAFLVSGIVGFMLFAGGDDDQADQAEDAEIAEVEDVSDDKDDGDAEGNSVGAEKSIIAEFDGSKPLRGNKGWNHVVMSGQKVIAGEGGIRITNAHPKTFAGIKFPLKSHSNDMFDQGWKLTYVVKPVRGRHRLGFHLGETYNPGWDGGMISLYLLIDITENKKVRVMSLSEKNRPKPGRVEALPMSKENGWYTITVEQKAEDASGTFSVSIDGTFAFKDTYTTKKKYNGGWDDHLFSSAFDKRKGDAWLVKELKLETL